jgi:hypothetical protein
MSAHDLHLRTASPPVPATRDEFSAPASSRIDWHSLQFADHACCCPAKPAAIVVMPPSPGRSHQTDLLLCGHHYRQSQETLARAGAMVFSLAGAALTPEDRWAVGAENAGQIPLLRPVS